MSKSKKQNQDEKRDHVLETRFDNLTENESQKLREGLGRLKRKFAPESRGTYVAGTQKQLPGDSRKELE